MRGDSFAATVKSLRHGIALTLVLALAGCMDEAFSTEDEGGPLDAGADTVLDTDAASDAGEEDAATANDAATGDASGNDDDAGQDGGVDDGDAGDDAADDGCIPVTWYKDEDGDGWGNEAVTLEACERPGLDWVAQKGDCHDGNADVNPDQTQYFGIPYTPPKGSVPSFDYNCDGIEEGDPAKVTTNTTEKCTINGTRCEGAGYVAGKLRGEGFNDFCGSVKFHNCNMVQLGVRCESEGVLEVEKPYACR